MRLSVKKPLQLSLISFLLILLIGGLCGCGRDAADHTGPKGSDRDDVLADPAEMSDDPAFTADDSLITELYSESGSYTDEIGNTYAYNWHVPQIKADGAEAKALNQYLASYLGSYVEAEQALMQQKASLHYTDISWQRYWQGSRLFLKLTASDGSYRDMEAVCYDFASDKRIEPRETLADLGVSEEAYLKALRRAALEVYDSRYTDHMKRREYYNDGGFSLRAQTLGTHYLNTDRALYINEQNELTAIVPVASIAGAAWYLEELPVDISGSAGQDLHAADGFISADLAGGVLTVQFHENEDAQYVFGSLQEPPTYDKAYVVDGIYGQYRDMLLANLGNSIDPYLFLLTNEGRVEFVDLANGMRSGYYCSGGVLPKTTGVQRIEAKTVSEESGAYQTVVSVNGKGKEKDLTAYVYAMQSAVDSSLTGCSWHTQVTHTAGGRAYREDYWIELSDDHSLRIDNAAAEGTISSRYDGSYDYLGMTADGLIAVWNAKEKGKNKTRYQGVWAMEPDPMTGASLLIEQKAGRNLFDSADGAVTYWEQSVG